MRIKETNVAGIKIKLGLLKEIINRKEQKSLQIFHNNCNSQRKWKS